MSEMVNITEIFGEDVFSDSVMKERLPKKVYNEVKRTIETGADMSLATADVVANAMKDWAVGKGATHYSHWFDLLPVSRQKSTILLLQRR